MKSLLSFFLKNHILKITFVNVLFLFFLLMTSCQSVENNHIGIFPEKNSNKTHVGQGVWMKIPSGFKKAKSYEGYQAPNSMASISVKTSGKSIEELKKGFEPSNLKKRKTVLLESSTVKYGDNEDAFFTVVRDKKKKTIRYLLAIAQGGRTYNIKAFYFDNNNQGYNSEIRAALNSVFIGNHQKKEELFKLASINNDMQSIIYTRDGKFPTESEDQATLEIISNKSTQGLPEKIFFDDEAKKITGSPVSSLTNDNLVNGKFYEGTSYGKNRTAYLALIKTSNESSTFIKCYGNEKCQIEDFKTFVKHQFMKTTIR